ncbi:MAG: ubiquinol-cytochrome c reductase iron-sulfur subunit [Calditrichia bacterium]
MVRNQHELTILSAKCTHLGCTIDRRDSDSLICPCHGSRYSFNGKVLKGPALKNLQTLNYKIDSENRKIIIDLPT